MECTNCKTPIIESDIEYRNGTNEEGDEYAEMFYTCDCGFEYEYSQWGGIETEEEAIELFKDKFDEQ
jgi:RNase P subunit RPR2